MSSGGGFKSTLYDKDLQRILAETYFLYGEVIFLPCLLKMR